MHCAPISDSSRRELLEFRHRAQERGDQCLAILLSGIDLYLSLGKEIELLQMMRDYAEHMREAIENTPSAKDLEDLYQWDPEPDQE